MKNEKTIIYTVFQGNYIIWKDRILKELTSRCEDVDFLIKEISFPSYVDPFFLTRETKNKFREIFSEIKKLKDKGKVDGLLLFGPYYDRDVTSIGLPVIIVSGVLNFGEWKQGVQYFYRGEKVLHSTLCEHDLDSSIYSTRFDELAEKIRLITALKRVKNSRLLNISDGNPLMSCEQRLSVGSKEYEDKVFKNLAKTFGLEIVNISWEPLVREMGRVDEMEAESIVNKWISEAKEVKNTTKEEIIKAAKMYLAILKLMKEYSCNMFTMNSWGLRLGWGVLRGESKTDTMPSLAEMELAKQGIVTSCESLIDCIVTQALIFHITGRPSFVGDTLGIDPVNNVVIFGHCYAPINPHGNDRVPYIIREHAIHRFAPEIVKNPCPGIQVEFPLNETVTVAKISLHDEKLAVFTGTTVDGRSLYRNFDNLLCKSKIVVKTDVEALLKNYDAETFGIHRVVVYGNYRRQLKDLATLIGYELVEEDKSDV